MEKAENKDLLKGASKDTDGDVCYQETEKLYSETRDIDR
jgi:Ca2+-binding EF-hand superfamily protein